jgi:1,4-dihydroxy-2-naphthoate polyprenyltransferase
VFVFFGLVAVLGTEYTQALRIDWVGVVLAVATGSLSSAVLVANNLRDIPTDREAEKITLAVRLGDARTRLLYMALVAVALVVTLLLMIATPWSAVALVAVPLGLRAARPIKTGAVGGALIPVLRDTGLTMLVWSIAIALALAISA